MMKVARHEEGNSEIQEHPSFLTHSFKVMPSFHKALNRCKARETAGSSWVGAEDFAVVLKAHFQLFI